MERKAIRQTAEASALAPRISAIVVVTAADAAFELCARAALADPWVDELIIVDAGAPAPLASALRGLKADRRDVRLIAAPGVGLWRARNLGADAAQGRWLLFLEPGVVLRRGAGARLVAAGRTARAPWLVGGRLRDASGRERPSLRRAIPTLWSTLTGAGGLRRGPRRSEAPAEAGAVDDGMVLIPREDFVALGGYSAEVADSLGALELCHKIARAGGAVRFAPRAEAVEFASPAERAQRGVREAEAVAAYVAQRAAGPISQALARFAAPLIRALLRRQAR